MTSLLKTWLHHDDIDDHEDHCGHDEHEDHVSNLAARGHLASVGTTARPTKRRRIIATAIIQLLLFCFTKVSQLRSLS